MKKYLLFFAVVFVLLTGCQNQGKYTLVQPEERITNISIIEVPNNSFVMSGEFSQFTILTDIDRSKWGSILGELSSIPCGTYLNAPADYICGRTLMITYYNNDIELIGPDSAYYYNVAQEVEHCTNYRPFYFDPELFNEMLSRYGNQ